MIIKELVTTNGSYEDSGGNEKTRWVNLVHFHKNENGKHYLTLHRHVNLAGLIPKDGETRIFVELFDPKPRQTNGVEQPQANDEVAQGFDDDIPF